VAAGVERIVVLPFPVASTRSIASHPTNGHPSTLEKNGDPFVPGAAAADANMVAKLMGDDLACYHKRSN